jgi:hypothetical protein
MQNDQTRRHFFKAAFTALLAMPVIAPVRAFASKAPACPQQDPKDATALGKMLKPTDPVVKRLDLVFNAADSKNKLYKAGMNCANCSFFLDKKEADFWAPCTMAANKYVPSCGWCKSYKKDPKKA